MADVGVHRFAAGDDQHQGAQDQENVEEACMPKIREAVGRIERGEDFGVPRDLPAAERGDDDEPDDEYRSEHDADARRALELDGEQRRQQRDRDRDDEIAESGLKIGYITFEQEQGEKVMTASIVGWAHTPFGKFDAETVESLVVKVANEALADAGIAASDVDEIMLGHFNGGFSPQDFTASLVLQASPDFRFKRATRVENACATGSAAVHQGLKSIAARSARIVLVVGV